MENTIGERIKEWRLARGFTLEELGKKANVSKVTIYKYENGVITNIPSDRIQAMSNALNISPAYLMGWTDNPSKTRKEESLPKNILPIHTLKLPMLGEIECGEPTLAEQQLESYIEVGTDIKADFCLRAKGDSMINARIFDGDIVFIRSQSSVENGEVAAVIIDDEATLKRVFYYPENNQLELRPENPMYRTLVYKENELDQIKILGKAIAFQSDVR